MGNCSYLITTLFIVGFLIIPARSEAQESADEVRSLWGKQVPGAKGDSLSDNPTLSVFLPERGKSVGTGVVIFPGGGYSHLAMEKEGYKVARWFNSLGIAAFVVKYRLGMKYHHPVQLMDGKRAVRMVRKHAAQWNLKPDRIGIMGFSAGGHLASTVGTHLEREAAHDHRARWTHISARPDFMILIYPVITMKNSFTHRGSRKNLLGQHPDPNLVRALSNEMQVSPRTPPTFLVHTSNDQAVPVMNSLQFYMNLREAGIAAEIHIYEDGPHGYGLAQEYDLLSSWPGLCAKWLRHRRLLDPATGQKTESTQ